MEWYEESKLHISVGKKKQQQQQQQQEQTDRQKTNKKKTTTTAAATKKARQKVCRKFGKIRNETEFAVT